MLRSANEERLRAQQESQSWAASEIAAATQEAKAIVARAERKAETQAAQAEAVREQLTEDLKREQARAFERMRTTRDEAIELLDNSRREADQVRTQAHAMLSSARSEVAELAKRRDDIQRQLTELSGVIEALAVPGEPSPVREND